MAFRTYISVKGKDQKQFKGESTKESRKDKWVEAVDHEWESTVATDSDTGKAKGSVKMEPYYFVKEKGASSPQFFQAHVKNEVLEEVIIEEVGRDEAGKKEIVVERITFEDATVVHIKRHSHNATNNVKEHDLDHLEKIGIRARKVTIENLPASTSTTWDWNTTTG